jgi:RNA polymerase sigma-70 factor (ECF subfamily)
LEEILRALRPRVMAYVQRQMPDDLRRAFDPQDILQDTWHEAFMRMHQFKAGDPDAVYRWLATIAHNRLVHLIRMHRARKRGGDLRHQEMSGDGSLGLLLEHLAVYRRTPSASAAGHELVSKVEQSLRRLPEDQGQAVRMRHLDGLDVSEAAARMGRSPGAFRMLCNRGLKALRVELRSVSLYA